MIVFMYRERFIEPIIVGTKRQTIRPTRARSLKVGEMTSHRFWEGRPYWTKQIEIATGPCIATFPITVYVDSLQIGLFNGAGRLTKASELDKFARSDGFESWEEMIDDFSYGLPFVGELTQWQSKRISYTQKKLAAWRRSRRTLIDTGRMMV